MGYIVNGIVLEADDQGYLLEPDFGDEVAPVIAEVEGIALTDAHLEVIEYLRASYREHGHSPSFRTMLKELHDLNPAIDSKYLYELFPLGPAKQGARIAGLTQPFGKAGY
jgi:tRNA 2-thiouridine synthesizing protein E